MRTRLAATAVLILAWGSTFTSIKVSLEGCPPMLLAGGRCVVGGALVALVAALLGRRPGLRGNLAPYAALALLNVVGFFGLQTLAIDHLPSGFASVLLYLQPVLTVLLAAPFLGDRLTASRLVGAAHGVRRRRGGVAGPEPRGLGPRCPARDRGGGVLVPRHDHGQAGRAAGRAAVGGGAPAGRRRRGAVRRRRVTGETSVDASGRVVVALVWTTLVGTTLAWLLWMYLVAGGDVGRVAVSIFLVPVVAVVLGWWLLDESRRLVAGRRHRAGVRRRAARERRPASATRLGASDARRT